MVARMLNVTVAFFSPFASNSCKRAHPKNYQPAISTHTTAFRLYNAAVQENMMSATEVCKSDGKCAYVYLRLVIGKEW
jgi:hypothetical protein